MTINDTTSSKPKKQSGKQPPVNVIKALLTCMMPLGIGLFFLILFLYLNSIIPTGAVDEFLKINKENINYMFFFIYLNIFFLFFTVCVSVTYFNDHSVGGWVFSSILLFISYCLLLWLYCHSFFSIDGLSPLQDNLATFIWLPIWLLVGGYFCHFVSSKGR
ncbi:MAG: hypothetical protein CME38_14085 [Haliea sp.]|jgi:hypothetical protein|nr:hypothetical protein [Haliea sp.]|tara:strand:- start:8959 stop:9441 length:483 start_codon:yes stop_codon:yes gene_type:complete